MNILKTLIWILPLIFTSCRLSDGTGTSALRTATGHEIRIKYGSNSFRGLGWAAAHAPIIAWIKFKGKKYSYLLGEQPYFTYLAEENSIAFFQNRNNRTYLVLVDTDNGNSLDISGNWGGYGDAFCDERGNFKDFIQSGPGKNKLSVISITPQRKYVAVIDMNAKKKIKETIVHYHIQ